MDRVYCRQEESYVRAKLMQYSRRRRRPSDSRRPNNRRRGVAQRRLDLTVLSPLFREPEIPDERFPDFFDYLAISRRRERIACSIVVIARFGEDETGRGFYGLHVRGLLSSFPLSVYVSMCRLCFPIDHEARKNSHVSWFQKFSFFRSSRKSVSGKSFAIRMR